MAGIHGGKYTIYSISTGVDPKPIRKKLGLREFIRVFALNFSSPSFYKEVLIYLILKEMQFYLIFPREKVRVCRPTWLC